MKKHCFTFEAAKKAGEEETKIDTNFINYRLYISLLQKIKIFILVLFGNLIFSNFSLGLKFMIFPKLVKCAKN